MFNEQITGSENSEEPLAESARPAAPPASLFSTNERKKRNSGRSGATSAAGRSISALNAIKHGACSQTLILKGESEASWLLLLDSWCQTYHIPPAAEDNEETEACPENSLLYRFVLKAAQAEWFRIRCQRNFDFYVASFDFSPFNWSADQLKMHDLLLRYKTTAERTFHRENRALDQHYKLHKPHPEKTASPESSPASSRPSHRQPPKTAPAKGVTVVAADPASPTGYSIVKQIENGREIVENRNQPFQPPDPLPPSWPKFHLLDSADKTE